MLFGWNQTKWTGGYGPVWIRVSLETVAHKSAKLHWVTMVAQLLLEDTDRARSLLVGTIAKYASQHIYNTMSDKHVDSYMTDCITAYVIFDF